MRKFLLIAALAAISAPAQATEYDLSANEAVEYCQPWVDGSYGPEDFGLVNTCWRIAADWLYDNNRADLADADPNSVGNQPTDEMVRRAECAARIILSHGAENTPVADILSAEYDRSCSTDPPVTG